MSHRRPCFRLILTIVGVLVTLRAGAIERVLVLQSYSTDYQWTRDSDHGIRTVLVGAGDRTVSVRFEYLDTKNIATAQYLAGRANDLALKYDGVSLDGIIAVDNHALLFLARYRDTLFGTVPTIFAGINGFYPEITGGLADTTGLVENLSVHDTLEMISTMFPDRDRLILVGGDTITAAANFDLAIRALGEIEWDPEITVVVDPDPVDLQRLSESEVSGTSTILLLGAILDSEGHRMLVTDSAKIVPELVPTIPIFTLWDFFIGDGVLGGMVARGTTQGIRAAELMIEVLDGTPASAIPVVKESPNEWVFDSQVLNRFAVPADRVPANAVLVNHQPGVWDLFRDQIIAYIFAVITLVAAIVVLLNTMRVREASRRAIATSLAEKDVLLREIHHRVKNNLQVISSILNMQGRTVTDRRAVGHFLDCNSRVRSMALVHEHLYQSQTLSEIAMPKYIDELVHGISALMAPRSTDVRVSVSADDISLDLDTAIPVGLLVNELVSNTFKHGVENRAGRDLVDVEVSFTFLPPSEGHTHHTDGSSWVALEVADGGPGVPGDPDTSKSLGLQLVGALVEQVHGKLEYVDNRPGLRARILFPLPKRSTSVLG